MIRPVTLLCALLAAGSGLYLYQAKHRVKVIDRQIIAAIRQIDQARERTTILRAEWALLNEPDRLNELATRFLNLQPLAPTQFVAMADLDSRLPPPGPLPGTTPDTGPAGGPEAPLPVPVAAATPPLVATAAAATPATASAATQPGATQPAPAPAAVPATSAPAPATVASAAPRPAPVDVKPLPAPQIAAARPTDVRSPTDVRNAGTRVADTQGAGRPAEPHPAPRPAATAAVASPPAPHRAPPPERVATNVPHAAPVIAHPAPAHPAPAPAQTVAPRFVSSVLGMAHGGLPPPVPLSSATGIPVTSTTPAALQ